MTENHNSNVCDYIDWSVRNIREEVRVGHEDSTLKPIHIPVERDGVVP